MPKDIFGRDPINKKIPITADACTIVWDGNIVTSAIQLAIQYNQQITRRRSIGSEDAIIYGSQPVGQATIALLLTTDRAGLFGTDSWLCKGGTVEFLTGSCEGQQDSYTANGCIVSGYSIQASAEDLTVMDNVTIDFLELVV